jgi:TonB family protein
MPHPLTHGIQFYFAEHAANLRRVALVLLSVSTFLGLVVWLGGRRMWSGPLNEAMRFGYEGPEQWVERIRLEDLAREQSQGLYAITYLTLETRKGGKPRERISHPQADVTTSPTEGLGEDVQDLLAKARMLSLDGPLIRSENLIIERLVRPDYPEEALDQGIEGLVEFVALVDTSGSVLQVQIVGGTRNPLLEHAAAKATLACRYRPYRVGEHTVQVWAMFRISFALK